MIQLPKLYERIKALEIFEKIDLHFGVFLSSHALKYKPEVFLTGIFLSRYTREGHTCVPLTMINRGIRKLTEPASHRDLEKTALPSEITIEHLTESGIADKETGCTPVVICHGHLYLQKYWHYEKSIAGIIERMTGKMDSPVNSAILRDSLTRLFPAGNGSESPDRQKTASIVALKRRFFVLTGGPGTGKTTTLAKILALLLEQNSNLSIAVAAPTGKAAGRIEESLKREKEKLDISDALKGRIPSTASTIHRLLKPVIYSPHFRHNRISPLTADVVVVDEASMVDLPLMAKLLDSLREGGRLILAGDKNQLASVETGSVFGDVCAEGWLRHSVIELKKNYRFGDESLIGKLSREIVQGSEDGVIELLSSCREPSGREPSGRDTSGLKESGRDASYSTTSDCHQSDLELVWRELPERQHFRDEFIKRVRKNFLEYAKSTDVSSAFRKLLSLRVLSPLRKGWCGVETLNRIAEEIMAERNPSILARRIYPLKPLLITSNDYNLKLYNGDLGIVFPDEHKKLRAYFESDTGASDPHRSFFTGRLPEYEPAFAMTVHKSQGSEFEDVLLILPPEESPVLTRELLYTAVTRARKRVEIWGSEEIIRKAARNKTERISGIEKHLKADR